jgi:hypothetical protein
MSLQRKPSIVFVHGLWADGSCFSKLIPTLQKEGFEVIASQHGLDSHAGDVDCVKRMKLTLEPIFAGMDWEDAARELIKRKNEWHGLDFFAQSNWKSAFFGLSPERFKMVAWE